jgi:hypothetical protein
MLEYLIICWILLCSVSIICLKPKDSSDKPCQMELSDNCNSQDSDESLIILDLNDLTQSRDSYTEDDDMNLYDIIRDKRFWYLYTMNFSSIFYGYVLITSYKVFGSQCIHDDMFLTMVGSVACVCGSLRFFWSMLLDYNYTYV